MTDKLIEQAIDQLLTDGIILEGEMLDKVKAMTKRGMSALAIATALSLPLTAVQNAVAGQHHTKVMRMQQLSDRDKIARTLWAEARGDGDRALLAVASVIYNRARGNTLKMGQVVTAPKQFSEWNDTIPPAGTGDVWNRCLEIADEMLDGSFKPLGEYNHFYNPAGANPGWAYANGKLRPFTAIGHQHFLTIESEEAGSETLIA